MLRIPFSNTLSIILVFFCFSIEGYSQRLNIDFNAEKREESSFKIRLLRHGIIGVSSLQHLDLSAEVLQFRYLARGGTNWGLTLYSTQTLWRGNKQDLRNTFDFLMNPIGGLANGSISGKIPFKLKPDKNSNLQFFLGSKWIEGPPAPAFRTPRFFDHYLHLGWLHQRLLAEDPLTNSSLSFWLFPYFQLHQSSAANRTRFFEELLPPLAQGYGLEIGIDYNRQLKLSLYGQQLLNATPQSALRLFVARLIVAYRF